MKFLGVLLFSFGIWTGYASEEDIVNDVPELVAEIKKVTEDRWKVEGALYGLRLESKERFRGILVRDSDPEPEPNKYFSVTYIFYLKFVEKVDPKNYEEYKAELTMEKKRLVKLCRAKMGHEMTKVGGWRFYPRSKEEWKHYLEYSVVDRKLSDLPQYYYKGVGVRYRRWHYELEDRNAKEYLRVMKDVNNVFGLLEKYK